MSQLPARLQKHSILTKHPIRNYNRTNKFPNPSPSLDPLALLPRFQA